VETFKLLMIIRTDSCALDLCEWSEMEVCRLSRISKRWNYYDFLFEYQINCGPCSVNGKNM